MPGSSWYYRPTNSARYTPVSRRERTFFTEITPRKLNESPRFWMERQKSSIEIRESLDNLNRPTLSSSGRNFNPGLNFAFSNRYLTWDGNYIWNRMDFLRDSKKCVYRKNGSVKYGKAL